MQSQIMYVSLFTDGGRRLYYKITNTDSESVLLIKKIKLYVIIKMVNSGANLNFLFLNISKILLKPKQ